MKSKIAVTALVAGLALGWTGGPTRAGSPPPADSIAARLYRRACGHVARGHLDLAYASLKESFGYGFAHPMKVVSDTCLAPLLADSAWRLQVHDLLRRHAWEDSAVMVPSDEPGERIRLIIRLVDGSGKPVSRAVVELLQAGVNALPAATGDLWNPRIFACLRTGDSGQAQVETVRPGTHGSPADTPSSACFQASFTLTGRESVRGEIRLEDDSFPEAPESPPVEPGSVWVARRLANTGKAVYRVEIALGQP
jgi:hypothetical protein